MRRAIRTAVATSLALIVGLGSVATAHAEESETMPMSESEFISKAVEVGGLTVSEAREAYANPDLAANVPVATEVFVGSTTSAKPFKAANLASAETMYSCSVWMTTRNLNVLGQWLTKYQTDAYWDFALNDRVRSGYISYYGTVSDLGSFGGWRFDRTVDQTTSLINQATEFHGQQTGKFVQTEGDIILEHGWTSTHRVILKENGDWTLQFLSGENEDITGNCLD